MIVRAGKEWYSEELPEFFLPCIRKWFYSRFKALTPAQRYSFKLIHAKKNVLITSPTGSGKTLAAFLSIINELFLLAERNELEDKIYCIYISPLRALDNDVHRNLQVPLKEIREMYGKELPEIRVGLRTGDVLPSEKSRQLKKPPHILITTPESIAIMLNAPKFAEALKDVKWVIVDEIHELASSKRGVHLSLSLERLVEMCGREFVRIGLGATLHPLEEAARFLVGNRRECYIVDVSWEKEYDLKVVCPVRNLILADETEVSEATYRKLYSFIKSHRTTLIFTNTRSATEKVVYNLREKFFKKNPEVVEAHHGSLSREIRLDVEERLKKGKLKAVVCSTSLELGVDIGYVDLVVQISSPKSVTRAVQRIGRSGRGIEEKAKGRIIVLDKDDLLECSVMLKCAKERKLDRFKISKNCLDVLCQHIVGMALNKRWKIEEAYRVVKRSYCYRDLSYEDFLSVLYYLAGRYVSLEDQRIYAKIWLDEEKKEFGRRGKYTRVIYYLNLGTIPDEVKVDVYSLPSRKYVGSIEEEFLERLRKGDIFVLGGKLYRFLYARAMRCFVEPVKEASPTIPSWFSEMLPLSFDLAREVRKAREVIAEVVKSCGKTRAVKFVRENFPVDLNVARSIVEYISRQMEVLYVPRENEILVEKTYGIRGENVVVFHALYGRKVNDALSRAVASLVSDDIDYDVGITISDNGFTLILPEFVDHTSMNFSSYLYKLCESDIERLLKENVRRTELMKRRFRHCAARSFLVLRNYKGHKISVAKQQINAQIILKVVERLENFPVLKETYREILYDVMDLENAKRVLNELKEGKISVVEMCSDVPSPFAHGLIVLADSDIVSMKDRRKKLIELWKRLSER